MQRQADARPGLVAGAGGQVGGCRPRLQVVERGTEMVVIVGQRADQPGSAGKEEQRQPMD